MPKLTLLAGPGAKFAHELSEDVVTVGRAPDNVVQIDDPSVSSRHAQLSLVGESYQLKDLGSTNGTRVNGETVVERLLQHGDVVRFGKADARFEADVAGEARPLPELQEIAAQPAVESARPVGFANASPFPRRSKNKDAVRTALLAFAALAFLAFVASMIAVLSMHAPQP
jgi:pSer/pThr/pTyr-binding forkhead associated (FHA) protein